MSWIVLGVIVAIGVTMAALFARGVTKTWVTMLVITGLVGLGYGVISTHNTEAAKDRKQARREALLAAINSYHTQVDIHNQCLEKIERSKGNRLQWEDTSAYLESKGLEDAAAYIQQRLDLNLPVIDPASCPPLPTGPEPKQP